MIEKPKPEIDWRLTTWKGSRLQQHREFHALRFARKLELIEEMTELVEQFRAIQAGPPPRPALREDPPKCESEPEA